MAINFSSICSSTGRPSEIFDLDKSPINNLPKEEIELIIKEYFKIKSGGENKINLSNHPDSFILKYVFAYFSKK